MCSEQICFHCFFSVNPPWPFSDKANKQAPHPKTPQSDWDCNENMEAASLSGSFSSFILYSAWAGYKRQIMSHLPGLRVTATVRYARHTGQQQFHWSLSDCDHLENNILKHNSLAGWVRTGRIIWEKHLCLEVIWEPGGGRIWEKSKMKERLWSWNGVPYAGS